ncbi:MAG: ABC transporter ATP-binding protein, partial [Ruminococcaceae bacterium]|nr:ABC transporter ATP-binding protein [Oscillospiraceae bacterium]
MLKLLRYLKPYLVFMLLIIMLLYVQAMADLELPSQMARIVNTGLQQRGVETAVPDVMRRSLYDRLIQMSDSTLQNDLAAAYKLVPRGADKGDWLERYPLLQTEPLAILQPLNTTTRNRLNTELTPWLFIIHMQESGTDSGFALERPAVATPEDMFTAIKNQLDELPSQVLEQGALAAVAAEYERVGLDLNQLQSKFIWRAGAQMLLIALISAIASILVGLLAARLAAGVGRDLRADLFRKVTYFSSTEYDSFSPASLITRSTNDVQQIQMMLVMLLRILFYAPILGVGGVLKATRSNLSMGWIIALAVTLLLGLIVILSRLAIPRFKLVQKLVDRVNLVTREMLSGLMVIRAFNRNREQEAKFDRANTDLTRVNLFVNRLMVMMWPVMTLIMNGISLLIIRIGADQIDQGSMQVGDVMAFIQYTMQIIMSFLMVSMIFIMIPRASVSAQRIDEVLKVKASIRDPELPLSFPADGPGEVELREVSFRYPGADSDVLHQ